MASVSDGEELSLKHGVRCVTGIAVTVEDVLIAAAEQVGGENIVSASRMNKAVVIFLKKISFVTKITASGLWIKGTFVQVNPLSAPASKVTISNVPPFINNEVIERELLRFGKFAGPMRMISLGCKVPELQHVTSFRRQIPMFLNSSVTLDVSFRVKHGVSTYMVFATTDRLRCFECGDIGHLRRACPHKDTGERGPENENEPRKEQENRGTSQPSGASDAQASAEPGDNVNADPGEGTSKSGEQAGVGDQTVVHPANKPHPKEDNKKAERKGRTDSKRTKSSEYKEDRGQSAERKKGRAESKTTTENADVDSGGTEQVSESNTTQGNSELSGVSSEMSEEMVSEDGVRNQTEMQEDDGELSDSSIMSDITASQMGDDSTRYSFEDISDYLDLTKGRAVNVLNTFPDGKKFIHLAKYYMKNMSLDNLSSQKRYRLKKHCTTVRKSFKNNS